MAARRRMNIWLGISVVLRPIINLVLQDSSRCRVIVLNEDKLLLVRSRIGSQQWSLPGGGIHKKEQPLEGAIREIKEEVGLDIANQDIELVAEGEYIKRGKKAYYYYLFKTNINESALRTQKFEIIEAQWFSRNELPVDSSYFLHSVAKRYLT